MLHKTYHTRCGDIHYWVTPAPSASGYTLVFLPGLTADHRLFDKQVEYFAGRFSMLVWDAPGHAASWPFTLDFTLADKANWLHEILQAEHIEHPVIVGQSMGGYVAQMFMQLYPGQLRGFVSVDSAPLGRRYITSAELWLLERMEPVYRHYPWKWLKRSGCNGVAVSTYGRDLMRGMMDTYEGDQARYAKLSGHGFRILAEAIRADLPYEIDCPAMLLCGDHDAAGSCKRYDKAWHKVTGIPLHWIKNAGHNANTDNPDQVNALIDDFLASLPQ